ncbi:MAG: VWA domain-containing protein [Oleiphilaceae bacterium]|nr:VWA domain-containing protein [Oleiphilaceae bacterium]
MSEFISQFHFLRPLWLLALCGLPLLYFLRHTHSGTQDWRRVIDPALLQHLMPHQDSRKNEAASWPLLLALTLLILALSGPSWKKIPQPALQVSDNMVIVLDLSLSMLAADQKPDRLTRAKQKIHDLLKLRREGNTALIAFSGDAHAVTPLTDDIRTIQSSLDALDPFIMPVVGSRPDLALKLASELLQQGGAPQGRIVLIGDDITPAQAKRMRSLIKDYRLDIIAVGTAEGGPISIPQRGYLRDDNNAVVIPQTNFEQLQSVAQNHGGKMVRIQLNDSDLEALDISGEQLRQAAKRQLEEAQSGQFDRWEDGGYWLLLLAVPFIMLAYRQGALALLLVCVLSSENSYALSWDDLWLTKDQQAQRALDQGDADRAAALFESPEHRAQALYESGQYAEAAKIYEQLEGQHYNRGNALAKSGQLDAALAAYEQALIEDPENEDALVGKQIVEEVIEQIKRSPKSNQNGQGEAEEGDLQQGKRDQQSQQSQQQDTQSQLTPDEQGRYKQQTDPNDENARHSKDKDGKDKFQDDQGEEEVVSDEENGQQNATRQARLNEEPDSANEDSEAQGQAVLDELSEEEKRSYEQWLRRVPDDPSGLLRRKFEYQSRERSRIRAEEGEPLW